MKILHILNEFGNVGNGIVNVCCDLACEQAKNGNEVLVVSKGGDFVPLLESFNGKHTILSQDRSMRNVIGMMLKYRKIIRRFKPDIVHAHMITGAFLGFFGKFLSNHYKLVSTVHNVYQKGVSIMNYSDKIVCLSPKIENYYLSKGINKNKLAIIENGIIDSERRLKINQINKKNLNHPNIITLGAVCERKGSDILFNAFCKLFDKFPIHLYYVGNMDWPELEKKISKTAYANYVHFIGLEKQPLKYLLDGDVFVLPSRRETFPLSILEAKEAGLPIIASDTDGNPDALDNGQSGILFKTSDVEDLYQNLLDLVSNKERLDYFKSQSIFTSKKYTVSEMNRKYIDLYKSVL